MCTVAQTLGMTFGNMDSTSISTTSAKGVFIYPDTRIPPPEYSKNLLLGALSLLQSFCGSSTVAIDNKIEQAMDLVKSHLMYAVREEIEELKEQIKQLIEKNNQLEYENNILKSAASQETLSKLSQPRPQPPPSSSS
ncbi:hypothetical protein FSP39_014371 [Pinctada imbricata]|uniref:Uncharacterized protein n=1 Tax=Pinctada imbricata TaxID=66713 RepID=A0AA88Y485_PINIB|nr:hypothetical protein FSP39_014371 [Pinctada imbricata]